MGGTPPKSIPCLWHQSKQREESRARGKDEKVAWKRVAGLEGGEMEDVGGAEGCIWARVTLPKLLHGWVSQCAAVPAASVAPDPQKRPRAGGCRLQAGWFVFGLHRNSRDFLCCDILQPPLGRSGWEVARRKSWKGVKIWRGETERGHLPPTLLPGGNQPAQTCR